MCDCFVYAECFTRCTDADCCPDCYCQSAYTSAYADAITDARTRRPAVRG